MGNQTVKCWVQDHSLHSGNEETYSDWQKLFWNIPLREHRSGEPHGHWLQVSFSLPPFYRSHCVASGSISISISALLGTFGPMQTKPRFSMAIFHVLTPELLSPLHLITVPTRHLLSHVTKPHSALPWIHGYETSPLSFLELEIPNKVTS